MNARFRGFFAFKDKCPSADGRAVKGSSENFTQARKMSKGVTRAAGITTFIVIGGDEQTIILEG